MLVLGYLRRRRLWWRAHRLLPRLRWHWNVRWISFAGVGGVEYKDLPRHYRRAVWACPAPQLGEGCW